MVMLMFMVDHGHIHDMTNNQLINTFPPNAALKNGSVQASEYSVVHLLIIFCLSWLIAIMHPPIIDYL